MKIKRSPMPVALWCLVLFGACKKPPEVQPGGNGQVTTVYVSGADINHNFVYWKNGVAASVPANMATSGAFYVSRNNIYAGGCTNYFIGPDKPGNAEYWDNGAIKALPAATGYAFATAIFASGTDIYTAGYTYYPDRLTVPYTKATASYPTQGNVATYWKNGVAVALPSEGFIGEDAGFAMTNYGDYVTGLFVSGDDVYISGGSHVFQVGVGSTYHFAKYWKNGVPTDLVTGLTQTTDSTETYPTTMGIYVAGSDVYLAGFETYSSRIGNLIVRALYWKNGVPTFLTSAATPLAMANSIFVSGSDVYVAGYVTINSVAYATYWKNGVATNLTTGAISSIAGSIFVSGTDVYLAGTEYINGVSYAVYWKNGVAVKLGANYTASSIYVQ